MRRGAPPCPRVAIRCARGGTPRVRAPEIVRLAQTQSYGRKCAHRALGDPQRMRVGYPPPPRAMPALARSLVPAQPEFPTLIRVNCACFSTTNLEHTVWPTSIGISSLPSSSMLEPFKARRRRLPAGFGPDRVDSRTWPATQATLEAACLRRHRVSRRLSRAEQVRG